jgi:hypothetical protein
MTKPSLSWIEASYIAELVHRCRTREVRAPPIGPIVVKREMRDAVAMPPLEKAARPAPPPPKKRAAPVVPDFRKLGESIEARIALYLDWVTGPLLGARVAFIGDDAGLPLGSKGDLGDIVAVSTSVFVLLDDYQRELPAFEFNHVTLDMARPQGQLHLVVVRTDLGRFCLGAVHDELLERPVVDALVAGLNATLSE